MVEESRVAVLEGGFVVKLWYLIQIIVGVWRVVGLFFFGFLAGAWLRFHSGPARLLGY